MKISEKEKDGAVILGLSGDVDFHSSPELRGRLQKILEKKKKILVNLKKVDYIDSSGLATFVEALQKVRRVQGQLVLQEPAAAVRSVFEIAKLDSVFSLAASEEEALQLLHPSPVPSPQGGEGR